MTISLSANWTERAERDTYEEAFVVSITRGVTTWNFVDQKCTQFSYPVAVQSVTPFAAKVDVKTRKLSIDSVTVMIDDDAVRDLIVSTRLRGAKIRIRHGYTDIPLTDFTEYWTGSIEGAFPEPSEEAGQGSIRFSCLSVLEVLRQIKITGYWLPCHPLEAIYKGDGSGILEIADIDSSLIETAVFDPDASGYEDISHLVVTRATMANFMTDGSVRSPVPAFDLIDELSLVLNGDLYVTELGQLSFRIFDPDATPVAAWDENVIDELKQVSLDDDLLNRVEFQFMAEDQATQFVFHGSDEGYGSWNGVYAADDTASQSAHAYPGTSSRVITYRVSSPWVAPGWGAYVTESPSSYMQLSNSATTFFLRGPVAATFCGTREAGSGTSAQPANAQISADRPLYLLTNYGEIIKAESMVTTVDAAATGRYFEIQFEGGSGLVGPFSFDFVITDVTRGALGTTPQVANYVVDITTQQYLADQWLKRFSNGIQKVEVTTGLNQFDKEIGDFVTIDWPAYLAYGLNGIDAGDGSWEVIEKQHLPDENKIRWLLAGATLVVPTVEHRGDSNVMSLSQRAQFMDAVRNNDVVTKYKVEGFAITDAGGFDIDIGPGKASAGVTSSELQGTITLTLEASKDNYVLWDIVSRTVDLISVNNGDPAPDASDVSILIGKVVTDGSGIASIDTETNVPVSPINGQKLIDETVGYRMTKFDGSPTGGAVFNANLQIYSRG